MSKKGGMAPGLLRARRRDASLKPNRVLDKGSSRGMIYENEELRLRTINITSEIERGQSELKKLKRENEHLRREIWALRDEVDRLEALLKQKEQEEEEEEEDEDDEEEENGDEEGPSGEEPPTGDGRSSSSGGKTRLRVAASPEGLSVVVEEPEDSSSSTPEPAPLTTNCQVLTNGERRLEEWRGALPPCVRLNCVHPYTSAASLPPQLADLTASEVIEAVSTDGGLVGVRLLESSLYLSWRGRGELEHWLEQTGGTGLQLRDHWLQFTDVSQGTVVLALSAIPHSLSQSALLRLISQFGTVIGGVERRMYRGTDTGEGLVRLRPFASLPKRLFHEGAEISVRPLSHGELAALSMEPHQVLRLEKDGINMMAGSGSQSSSKTQKLEPINIPTPKSEKEVGVVSFEPRTRGGTSTPSIKSDPFIFPAASLPKKLDERSQSAPLRTDPQATQHGSNSSLRPHSDSEATTGGPRRRKSRRGKSPSSGSEQESPGLPRTPGSVVRRRASLAPPTDRERSLSLSSRAEEVYSKRKMSMTGRETGKLPWCACWGNGCY